MDKGQLGKLIFDLNTWSAFAHPNLYILKKKLPQILKGIEAVSFHVDSII